MNAFRSCTSVLRRFWPLVQLANFALVPPSFQGVVVNVVNMGWQTYLSYANHKEAYGPKAPPAYT